MAFKLAGFNPGKGTGMGSAFTKTTSAFKAAPGSYVKPGGKATGEMKDYPIGSPERKAEYDARGWKVEEKKEEKVEEKKEKELTEKEKFENLTERQKKKLAKSLAKDTKKYAKFVHGKDSEEFKEAKEALKAARKIRPGKADKVKKDKKKFKETKVGQFLGVGQGEKRKKKRAERKEAKNWQKAADEGKLDVLATSKGMDPDLMKTPKARRKIKRKEIRSAREKKREIRKTKGRKSEEFQAAKTDVKKLKEEKRAI